MTVARTAAHYGAVVRTSTQVVALLREGDRVTGVRVRDSEDGAVTEVRGPRGGQRHRGVDRRDPGAVQAARPVPGARVQGRAHRGAAGPDRVSEVAIILRTEKSVLFVIPWGTHWIIGTTDTDWNLDLAHPAATKADIDYILDHVNTVLATPLTHEDIDGVYAGLRPLLAGESEETSKLSREHAVAAPSPGLVAIAGGKYTTYRVMGADAIDAASEFVPTRVAPSITEKVPLMGADGYFALINQTEHVGARYGLHPYRVRHLLDRYGSLIGEVLAMAGGRPELLRADHRGAGVPEGGGVVRRGRRGGTAPGGHPGPPDAHLHRIPASRGRLCPRGRRSRRARSGLERRGHRPRGDDVPGAGGGRGAVADPARRRVGRRAAGCARPRRARRSSNRCRSIERRARPLPDRDGMGPARVRLRGGPVLAELATGSAPRRRAKVLAGEVVCADGSVVDRGDRVAAGRLRLPVPRSARGGRGARSTCRCCTATTTSWWWTSHISWRPCRVVVTSCRPRWCGCGASLELPELCPAHRLDRLTAGVLLFTVRREVRGAYQTLFARGCGVARRIWRAPSARSAGASRP